MTYTEFANKMLLAFYRESDGDTSAQVNMNSLAQRHGVETIKPFWIGNLKTEWAQNGWAHFPEDGTGRSETAVISVLGVREAEALPAERLPENLTSSASDPRPMGLSFESDSKLDERVNLSFDAMKKAAPRTDLSSGTADTLIIPASDRLVRFDHNSQEFEKISTQLDDLLIEVRENNQVGATAEERDRILRSLDAAKLLWASVELRVVQIKVGIILAVEEANSALIKVGKGVAFALLVGAIKAFFNAAAESNIF